MEAEAPTTAASTPPAAPKAEEPDPRASLRHVLADAPPASPPPVSSTSQVASLPTAASQTETPPPQQAQTSTSTPAPGGTPAESGQGPQNLAAITYTLRKNANGGISTVYSGSKIKYLKKDDGLPFWRRDIQYAFLQYVFQDKTRVFTKLSTGSKGHTFAETYIDAMANSSKCSQILKEKLLMDTSDQALDMAMVCLLVNVGRMNTTVNFFPEMRARVRTFHSIPCLQTHQSPQAYKQLQDGPRLKSILKGAMEDTPQPNNLEELANHKKPRTNPVSLIFVLAQYAPRISDLHFPAGTDFFDLFMRDTLTSKSRASALLWIVWWYLESDFTEEDAQRNPFGAGRPSNASDAMLEGLPVQRGTPMRVPEFDTLTEEEAANENVDPADEIEYGETKRAEREVILASDLLPAPSNPPVSTLPKRVKHSEALTPHSNSIALDESPSSSFAEPHQSHRAPPRSSSPFRGGEGRGAMTPASDYAAGYDEHPSRSRAVNRDRAQSGTPVLSTEQRSTNGLTTRYPRGRGTPEGDHRKGPGRGNYTRRIKAHPTQPFEQMHRPEQFGGVSDSMSSHPDDRVGSEAKSHGLSSHSPRRTGSRLAGPTSHAHYDSPNERTSHRAQSEDPLELRPTDNDNVHDDADHRKAKASDNANGAERPQPSKRSRQIAERKALERTRNDRVQNIIDKNILWIRQSKQRERKRRGVIVDAWIKARALSDHFDSEDEVDSLERHGGLDDVKYDDGTEVTVSVPLATASGNETKKIRCNPGDVGGQSSATSKTWRKMAQANGIEDIVERSRRRIRGAERDRDRGDNRDNEHARMEADHGDDNEHAHIRGGRRHSPLSYPTSNFGQKGQKLARAASADPADDDGPLEPAPKRRRRAAVRRPKGSGSAAKAAAATAAAAKDEEDEFEAPPRRTRGGRRGGASGGPVQRRKRKSMAGDTGAATSRKQKRTSSGSYAWVLDTGEKMEARRRGGPQAKKRAKIAAAAAAAAAASAAADTADADADEGADETMEVEDEEMADAEESRVEEGKTEGEVEDELLALADEDA